MNVYIVMAYNAENENDFWTVGRSGFKKDATEVAKRYASKNKCFCNVECHKVARFSNEPEGGEVIFTTKE